MKTLPRLHLYNTKTKHIEEFSPLSTQKVKIYSCGPTVYDEAHIGNLRAYVFADTLNRALRNNGYNVKHIINITDVGHLSSDSDEGDDKVEKSAKEKNENVKDVTRHYTDIFLSDLVKLNINLKKYIFPNATSYIKEQIDLVKKIEKEGLTYKIKDGIYFNTQKYSKYGYLGLQNKSESTMRTRIGENKEKKHSNDFALWKITPKGVKRQQEWKSPWGHGFPGWHIECSAMAMKLLGKQIDIHTGGIDHITIHHNNEIAQSESVTKKTFSKIWMHVSFLTIKKEKLSKSLKNSFTLTELIEKKFNPLAFRYLLLQSSYRSKLNFSLESLQASQTALQKLQMEYNSLKSKNTINVRLALKKIPKENKYIQEIDNAIADDLNTAKIIALLHNISHNTEIKNKEKKLLFKYANKFLGILSEKNITENENTPDKIKVLIEKRNNARKNKDYEKSDLIRKEIEKIGYTIKDKEDGTEVEQLHK